MDYITLTELAMLLAIFWLPIFLVAGLLRWRLLKSMRASGRWLLAAFLLEVVLAFAFWLSPLHGFFRAVGFLGPVFEAGAFPLQAALWSSAVVCVLVWVGSRLSRQAASRSEMRG